MNTTNNLWKAIKSNLQPSDHYIPIATKEITINNLLLKQETCKLDNINELITNLQKQQTDIQHNIKTYEDNNTLLKSLSAPYRKTPPEIISLIFRLLIPGPQYELPAPHLQDWLTTLNIFTHVSKYWHEIAISDPILWKILDLNIKFNQTKLATVILKRWISNMHINNLHLTISNSQFYSAATNFLNLYKCLDNCKQLKKLTLQVIHDYPQLHLKMLTKIKLPMLDSLIINEDEYTCFAPMPRKDTITLTAPKLTNLILNYVQPRNILNEDNLKNITKLKIDLNTYELSQYYYLLKKTPQLTTCEIKISCNVRDKRFEEVEEITLSHLTTLLVDMHIKTAILLTKINTPILSTLHISKNPKPNLKINFLIPFIHKTPTISQINIKGYRVNEEQQEFNKNLNLTHPNTTTTWINKYESIHYKFYLKNEETDTESESEFFQNASGFDYILSEGEEEEEESDIEIVT